MSTLEQIRETPATWENLRDLINAVGYVCSRLVGADVSLVQDYLDEASLAMDHVHAPTEEERNEWAKDRADWIREEA